MITVLYFIFLIFLYVIFCFAYCNGADEIGLWKDSEKIELRMPSIHDLDESKLSDYRRTECISEYISKAILPAHEYFLLRNKIEEIKTKLHTRAGASEVFFLIFSWLFLIPCVSFKLPNDLFGYLRPILYWIIIGLIAAVGLAAIFLPVKLIYKKKFSIGSFYYGEKTLRRDFERCFDGEKSLVPFDVAFNNYVISKHYKYLKEKECFVISRYNTCRVVETILILLFLLFGIFVNFLVNPIE